MADTTVKYLSCADADTCLFGFGWMPEIMFWNVLSVVLSIDTVGSTPQPQQGYF